MKKRIESVFLFLSQLIIFLCFREKLMKKRIERTEEEGKKKRKRKKVSEKSS